MPKPKDEEKRGAHFTHRGPLQSITHDHVHDETEKNSVADRVYFFLREPRGHWWGWRCRFQRPLNVHGVLGGI